MHAPGERLINADGTVRLGIFSEPVMEVNYRDFALTTPFGRPAGRWARHFGFNQFQFLGALCEDIVFGCVIADIKYVGTAFLYVYEPSTRRLVEHSFRAPLALGVSFNQEPETGCATFRSRRADITMGAGRSPCHRRLTARIAGGPSIDAYFDEEAPRQQPMRICTRAGATGWVFARKTAGMPVSGTVCWDGRTFDLAGIGARGHCDWSAGYMRRETFWNWGCIAGRTTDGRALGMNVACGVNETSFTENCFWVDGVSNKIDTVLFEYDHRDLMKPWQLRSFDGRLQLDFEPQASHAEKINAGIVASNFNQLLGRYDGRLVAASGQEIRVAGVLGYAESHYAKW